MKLKPFIAALLGLAKTGRFVGRSRVLDVAYPYSSFNYRMTAGFPGDVSRSHPASIEPVVNDATNPVVYAGQPVLTTASGNTVRSVLSTDTAATAVYGFAVRSFPFQQSSASAYGAIPFGASTLAAGQPVDVMRTGYILSTLNTGTAVKGAPVFVWVAATSGVHVQGGLETAASAGNTMALAYPRYQFNGPADTNGTVEISIS